MKAVSSFASRYLAVTFFFVNVILVGLLGYILFLPGGFFWNAFHVPCAKPITYSLGRFDAQFGISKKDFLSAVDAAAAMWEHAANRDLFTFVESGGEVTINLMYDYRQQATQKLQQIGISLQDSKEAYEALKQKYDALRAQYLQEKTAIDVRTRNLDVRKSAWQIAVRQANKRGGATPEEVARLEAEKTAINAEVASLNEALKDQNETISRLNAMGTELNRLIAILNLNVETYNTIGESTGGQFQEGSYQIDPNGQRINIYQYDSKIKLIRVLAHELGHTLRVPHVDDPLAMMYLLNQGTATSLTSADISALQNTCGMAAP